MVRGLLLGLVVGTIGCGTEAKSIGEDAYLEDYPSAYCELQERCYPERFADLFNSDRQACIEQAREPVAQVGRDDRCLQDNGPSRGERPARASRA